MPQPRKLLGFHRLRRPHRWALVLYIPNASLPEPRVFHAVNDRHADYCPPGLPYFQGFYLTHYMIRSIDCTPLLVGMIYV